ncbi:MAG TPA: hypothetical protein VJB16_00975, partial [archaeon]|nr:hypothetical protein [archaeon]
MTRNPVRWNTALLALAAIALAAIVILAALAALWPGPLQLLQQAALSPAGQEGRQAPSTFDTDAQSEWNEGTFNQTHANSSGFLKLNWTDFSTNATVNSTGNWSSKVFDSTKSSTQWNFTNWSSPWNASGQVRN